MRIPLVSGITTDEQAEFRTSYPVNLEIVPTNNKIAEAQFRAPSGAIPLTVGPGVDRGGHEWRGTLFRVMGTKLVAIFSGGGYSILGDVGEGGPVVFAEGFDRLGINSGDRLYYWDGALNQVTDPDLGPVFDLLWIDGYFMTTDGTSIVVTELNDPTSVEPLKYGSAEEDPDMVTGLIKVRDEPYWLGRYTIQVGRNVGGIGFPFATQKGASIPVGCVSPTTKCLFADSFAFVGSAREEALGVYVASDGGASRISTRWVDDELAKVADPTAIILENRTTRAERRLLVHLPDKTLVFLANASRTLEAPVWYVAQSSPGGRYRLRNATQAFGKTYVGDSDSAAIGILSDDVSTHFGEPVEWQFDAGPIYNAGKGFILKSAELVGLPGRAPSGEEPTMFMSMTKDGETFSVERGTSMGKRGERARRGIWRPRTKFEVWAGLRFRGLNAAMPGFAALEVDVEGLNG